jgi:hypothetical protein
MINELIKGHQTEKRVSNYKSSDMIYQVKTEADVEHIAKRK